MKSRHPIHRATGIARYWRGERDWPCAGASLPRDFLARYRGSGGRQLWLAGHGATLLVVGAARDVYPSGMMPDGRIAYRIHPGRRAERADVVDIFAPAEQGVIATVAEQKENFEAWIRSLAA